MLALQALIAMLALVAAGLLRGAGLDRVSIWRDLAHDSWSVEENPGDLPHTCDGAHSHVYFLVSNFAHIDRRVPGSQKAS